MQPSNRRSRIFGILSDLILWGLLLGVGGSLLIRGFLQWQESSRQVIRAQFRDANEITAGAPVRFMGTDVGTVQSIRLSPPDKPDHVEVVIRTYRHTVPIPRNVELTILFTGLGGAKSIEIIQVDDPTLTEPRVQEPIRLRMALQAQTEIAQALQHGAENFSDFFGPGQPLETLQENARATAGATATGVRMLQTTHQELSAAQGVVRHGMGDIRGSLEDFQGTAEAAVRLSDAHWLKPASLQATHQATRRLVEGHAAVMSLSTQHGLDHWNVTLCRLQQPMAAARHPLTVWRQPPDPLTRLERGAKSLDVWTAPLDAWCQCPPNGRVHERLQQVQGLLQIWKARTETLN